MYEKDGKKYFIFDSHLHFWDASPANWVKGHEEYAKGWIECFHAYQGLGPPETHWPLDKFQKYTLDDFEKDVFVDGVNKIDFDYEEIAEALGWEDFGNNDFEEIMSTHYGRMVVLDDRVLLFANPEDAAEYIDFDLQVVE